MRAHGVANYPDPNARNSGPGTNGLPKVNLQALGVSSSLVDEAEGACQRLLPNGAQLSRTTSRSILNRLVDFAHCMRSHGVSNWPDPTRTLGNFPGSPRHGFDLRGTQGLEGGCIGLVWATNQQRDRSLRAPPAPDERAGSVGLLAALRATVRLALG